MVSAASRRPAARPDVEEIEINLLRVGPDGAMAGQPLIRALAAHGVDTVFGTPRTHWLPAYRHLHGFGVRHVSMRREQGAVHAAYGHARVAGRPGVCLLASGTPTLDAMGAVAQAYRDSVPVLLVSCGGGQAIRAQAAAMGAVTAHSHRVASVAEIPAAVARAFAAMTSGRPRPAHIEVPADLSEPLGAAPPVTPIRLAVPAARDEDLDAAADLLSAAERPVIVAGGGARGAGGELRAVAERLGALVVTTAGGKGVIWDNHPLALGAGTHLRTIHDLVEQADAVLVVGTELAPSDLWNGPLPLYGRLARIDLDPAQIVTGAVPEVAVVADAAQALRGLFGRLDERLGGDPYAGDGEPDPADDKVRDQIRDEWRRRKRAESRAEGAEWLELVDALAAALPRDAVVASGAAEISTYGVLSNLPAYHPGAFLYGDATAGFGLPAAVGAKIADPCAPVVAVLDEQGAMSALTELAAAAALDLPLPVVVAGGQESAGGDGSADAAWASGQPPADLAAAAEAMGCHGVRVTAPEAGAEVMRAFGADRPTLIWVTA
ncbi:5-guanidino-2-oxopentanoate decarboxylase [Planotetraspora phitsanulokensis]|uniref:Putative 2-ketoarginine decarboxylase AruI n=1 Tax=Planotetraspora phitsanulokensis TaxID=575192 RepID=A0A8J3XHT3_9ACTN|nr:thiamine pyrophosphate-binding protein [Planotetraspora phitsanulokensis]GII36888.1 putative 2-ketoarginine decarboxylase AruI [Planotetraspora phitsanulokensis]